MSANLNIKTWKVNQTSRKVEEIELESGEVLRNFTPEKASTPVIKIVSGKANITCATTGATIIYKKGITTAVYTAPFSVYTGNVIKAYAVKADMYPSEEAEIEV